MKQQTIHVYSFSIYGGCFAMALLTGVGVANIWNPVGWGIISGVIGAGLLIFFVKDALTSLIQCS